MGNKGMRDEHNDRTMVERIDPLMGSVLDGRYRIDFRLAAGGFGAIYRATHLETKQQFALKVLHGDLATSDARVIARFRREGATLAQLKNPHTIQAYELGEAPDGSLYIVMELLHGESMYEQFRSKGTFEWQRIVSIGRQICSSLAEAHAMGIVHRDLKPANIHLENRDGNPDYVKVLDFGIAKIIRDGDIDSTELTQAGQMIGTFDYMAPEQMVGGQTTACTDIYTLGVVLYEMLTGQRPFADAQSPTAMLAALLTQTPPPLDLPGVPKELERILLKCLEREPQNRYLDVNELIKDFDRLLRPIQEAVTKRMNATPAPELVDEATVLAQPRAKRASAPPAEVPQFTIEQRPKRASEPPAQIPKPLPRKGSSPAIVRRDGTGPIPVGGRREGSGPVPVVDQRAKRESVAPNVIRRDATPDPGAWQSGQLPKRDPRDSQPVPKRLDDRDSQQVPVLPAAAYTPQPAPVEQPPAAYPAGSYPAMEPPAYYPPQHGYTPHAGVPQYQIPQTPSAPVPQPSYPQLPIPHTPSQPAYPLPIPNTPTPGPGTQIDPRASWQSYPQAPQAPQRVTPGYNLDNLHSRDVIVRRVVWLLALVLGVILVIVVMSRL